MEQLNDLELIQKFKKGDEQAFNQLVSRYQEKVYWVVRRLLPDHDEADDVVQSVFIKMYSSLSSFKGDSSLFTWLYRIATNLALNEIRRKKLKRTFSIDDSVLQHADPEDLPSAQLEKKELTERIRTAMERLPEKQKKVFVLRYYEEMPYEQIAKILKTSVGGLKANYFHAIRKIGEYLKHET
ncbi:MAG: sigma-70 family RNA polymerase sigma factor [Ignavibacteriales bacterium]|nr:sigma-70 family RNA polymerase sigma factor [Ignavibacteriales bacterium]